MLECLDCGWNFEEEQLDSDGFCGSCSEFGCIHNKLSWNCEPCTVAREKNLKIILESLGR